MACLSLSFGERELREFACEFFLFSSRKPKLYAFMKVEKRDLAHVLVKRSRRRVVRQLRRESLYDSFLNA